VSQGLTLTGGSGKGRCLVHEVTQGCREWPLEDAGSSVGVAHHKRSAHPHRRQMRGVVFEKEARVHEY
jgi:hypothetical protein